MSDYETLFRRYAEKHPDATVEETQKAIALDYEFLTILRKLHPADLQKIHDILAIATGNDSKATA